MHLRVQRVERGASPSRTGSIVPREQEVRNERSREELARFATRNAKRERAVLVS